jgi:addiction module HigA family antidote
MRAEAAIPPPATPAGVPRRTPVHPGRFLERHYLAPLAMSQSEAARRLGISRRRVHELISGERTMTPDTAIRCAMAFGLPATQWLALQAEWDSFQTWKSMRRRAMTPAQAAPDAAEARSCPTAAHAARPAPQAALAASAPRG